MSDQAKLEWLLLYEGGELIACDCSERPADGTYSLVPASSLEAAEAEIARLRDNAKNLADGCEELAHERNELVAYLKRIRNVSSLNQARVLSDKALTSAQALLAKMKREG